MNYDRIENCAEKVYGYAVNHTYSREEADELSQEILFTAVRELPKLKNENKFEPWLWRIAENVTKSFRRRMGKQRAMYSYDVPENLPYADSFTDDDGIEEVYDSLRTKVAMLSVIYRDIIILHYYDGLSTKEISRRLGIPEGTVTWRLSEARRKLKKECIEMQESALRPVKMKLDIYGRGNFDGKKVPFPNVYIDDALSQNILYNCYEEAHNVEELAKLCGVPAYYVEERIDNLMKREAIASASKGKYRTDFIIWSDKYGIYCEEKAEKALLPVMDQMLEALKNIAETAGRIDFYKAGKGEKDLFYLYSVMAFSHMSQRCCTLPYPPIKEKSDGYEWCYIGNMETGKHKRIRIMMQHGANLKSRGGYSHTVYCPDGFPMRQMMFDECINACEDILTEGNSKDIYAVTLAIQDGYIKRNQDGSFFVMVPAFTREQKAEFDSIAERYLKPLMEDYQAAVEKFLKGYKRLFPKHLTEDADRMCHDMFFSLLDVIFGYGCKTGVIELPSPESYCDVLIQKAD